MRILNILLLSTLASAMTVVSCSKDDKEVAKELKVPVGKFVFDTWTETKDGITSEERLAYKPECTDNKRYFDFKAEGEMEEKYVGTVDEPCAVNVYPGNYTQTGNVVTIIGNGPSSDAYTVLDVTATTLKIRRAFKTDPTHLVTFTLIKE